MACAILALCNCLVCPDVFWPIAFVARAVVAFVVAAIVVELCVVIAMLATHLVGFLFSICCTESVKERGGEREGLWLSAKSVPMSHVFIYQYLRVG